MSATLRFHLDENLASEIAAGLKRRLLDCTTTSEVGLCGASDDEQLAFAMREKRVIVTADKDFLRIASRRSDHCGIAFCHRDQHFGHLIRQLEIMASSVSQEEMQGVIRFFN